MNSKNLTEDLKTPGAKWVKGLVSELSRDWGLCDQGIEASIKVVSDCLAIPEIPKWMADVIEGSVSFERVVIKLGEIDSVSKASKVDYDLAAKAWVLGYTAEQPLGVLLVDMPEGGHWKYSYLYRGGTGKFSICCSNSVDVLITQAHAVTEEEAKGKYPNFKWVSLEKLENEVLKND